MPRISVNGEEREVNGDITIMDLLDLMGVKFREVGLAVAVNDEVVPKSEYKTRRVKEGDKVEIVQLVGGG